MKDKKRPSSVKPLARERIAVLFSEAEKVFCEDPAYSDRYVELARKISMKERVRIDREYRRQFCHHCSRYLMPGANMRVRVHPGWVSVTCLSCKKTTRYRVEKKHVNTS
ncbi:ribonuclease P [Methanoregula sp.]|uniref:ribonuclease P protein component 4 n=1 Tax=Methanoregula sp. TaxID=2052170 RepID=UPI002C4AB4CB|nr:ribonuclease P [Methanoregula sp.]HVP97232.1 ribonuclease P [Methanoregula sp.]